MRKRPFVYSCASLRPGRWVLSWISLMHRRVQRDALPGMWWLCRSDSEHTAWQSGVPRTDRFFRNGWLPILGSLFVRRTCNRSDFGIAGGWHPDDFLRNGWLTVLGGPFILHNGRIVLHRRVGLNAVSAPDGTANMLLLSHKARSLRGRVGRQRLGGGPSRSSSTPATRDLLSAT